MQLLRLVDLLANRVHLSSFLLDCIRQLTSPKCMLHFLYLRASYLFQWCAIVFSSWLEVTIDKMTEKFLCGLGLGLG